MGTVPESNLFTWPPTNHPAPLPPPTVESPSVMYPFNIPGPAFVSALDARVPLTIATVYAVAAKLLTRYNLSRGKRAWAISRTRPFFAFVVLHNVFLAVYSAWTFWGMLGGMRRSVANPFTTGGGGLAATADSLCRVHGGPGLGNSVYFDDASRSWTSLSHAGGPAAPTLSQDGLPSPLQPGRLWNEGLAYYGWIFYLSKFYEVLDTFIILAKGKPSSTLQTYHHAGAMVCMWAGIRFMSAPIWIFVLVNSFIHALMYTYYTLTAFSIKVPVFVKRTLTTMQITQFVLGASFAMVHSFVSYIIPLTITPTDNVDVTAAADANTLVPSIAAGAFDSLRQLVLGTAGDHAPVKAATASATGATEIIYVSQPCIVTAGETFAIFGNVLYLAPLTYLFVSFFIASYLKRSNAASKIKGKGASGRRLSNVTLAEKAGWDAARGVEKEVYGGENMVMNPSSSNGSPTK
ncbi:GNS1/SUR4 family [Geosmithia morbida]|uniref:Elongation of fatty acids protein n=1 Tax=Geosmithia morbida TaxID=1094350 RepID=A0A9P4YVZ3_9HYPO|nr:GNS1/SUR4 family [Geosmithia morbida]KAF4124118.1 GNS1/SUR4 family [Geosmithia morbida]